DDSIGSYYTRRQIDQSRMFAGKELVWLQDPLSTYIVHINGSAKLRLTDASLMYIGYAGKTDRPYTGLGQSMLDEGLLRTEELSLPAVRRVYEQNPKLVTELIYRNENYVFFTEYDGDTWPAGSLGVLVTAHRTLATDKKVYPRGGLVLVDTKAVTFSEGQRDFLEFMLDQDTGGAIQAPGRADMFMGVGASAEILAGGQYAEGRLYYFFLKPQYVQEYVSPRVVRAPR
ncbi:MAG: MltA domain-containing protein, partial [Phycisphaerales bacterium]